MASKNEKKKTNKKKNGRSKSKKLQRVTIYLTEDQIQYLDDVSEKIKVKRSTYIRMLIDSDMKGPIASPSHQSLQWNAPRTATPSFPPRRRKVSASPRKASGGGMQVHAELMNELKNVLKKRRETSETEKTSDRKDKPVDDKTDEMKAKKDKENESEKDSWKEKAKWKTPPPPPPPPPSS